MPVSPIPARLLVTLAALAFFAFAGSHARAQTLIDFDDLGAPCTFGSTVALTNEYQAEGVVFSGPSGNNGGAALDECGSFGVSGHSSPAFLAFNSSSTLSDGASPIDPETLTFTVPASSVTFNAGHSSGGTLTATAYDSSWVQVDQDSGALSSTLSSFSLTGNISYVVLDATGTVWVMDDLQFQADACVPSNILVLHTTDVTSSVQAVISGLGIPATYLSTSDFTAVNFAPYDRVVVAMDGGTVSPASVQALANARDAGKGVIVVGGSYHEDWVIGVDTYLIDVDTVTYGWTVSSSPHVNVLLPGHALAAGVTSPYTFVNSSAAYYQLRVTDPGATVVAQNGDGQPLIVHEATGGGFVLINNSAASGYWTNGTDFDYLDAALTNALYYIGPCAPPCTDNDGDGYGDGNYDTSGCPNGITADCDDTDPFAYPGATEYCNGVDDDCDGAVDDNAVDATTYYQDADGDGYGNASSTTAACSPPPGYVLNSSDCDDGNSSVYPGATEVCNGIDDDCDGVADDGLTMQNWYPDNDGDTYGDANAGAVADCAVVPGHVLNNGDCNDGSAAINPAATEICDGVDNDCDGTVDQNAVGSPTYYDDDDGDGYGDALDTQVACTQPPGYVTNGSDCDDTNSAVNPGQVEVYCNNLDDDCNPGTMDGPDVDGDGFTVCVDCNDSNANINPGAAEVCNGIDDDCDGTIDVGAVDAATWYDDGDGDGFGDPGDATAACTQPGGTVANASDCDDTDAAINPNATEMCDGVDNDCDGVTDENDAADTSTWYLDADGDGYGTNGNTMIACDPPPNYVATGGDCDDGEAAVHPGATEVCNGMDDDCNGQIDDGAVDDATWYADGDGDGYGNGAMSMESCSQPPGYVLDDTDCNDSAPAVHPGAPEICNGVDDDCDPTTGEADDDDNDGYSICDGDCDDGDAAVNPGAEEICNGIDDDCDPTTDEDGDGDGDGVTICDGDCDDGEAAVYPGAPELCDGLDDNCDGALDPDEVDGDGDGSLLCDVPPDCDDNDALTYPGAPEQCDNLDNDCDGTIDEDVGLDLDGDGYNPCQGDCDDTSAAIHPGATETCDGADTDCDGFVPPNEDDLDFDGWMPCNGDCDDTDAQLDPADADGDGWSTCDGDCDDGDPSLESADIDGDGWSTCDGDCDDSDSSLYPSDNDLDGYSPCDGDCDDNDPSSWPGFPEICDGADNDCNGFVDDVDADGDGHQPTACGGDDCDDADAGVHPGADEDCTDGVDNDCDGDVDLMDADCGGGDDDTTGDDDTGDDDVGDDDGADDDTDDSGDDDTDEGWGDSGCDCQSDVARIRGVSAGGLLALLVGLLAIRRRR